MICECNININVCLIMFFYSLLELTLKVVSNESYTEGILSICKLTIWVFYLDLLIVYSGPVACSHHSDPGFNSWAVNQH